MGGKQWRGSGVGGVIGDLVGLWGGGRRHWRFSGADRWLLGGCGVGGGIGDLVGLCCGVGGGSGGCVGWGGALEN